TSRVSRVQNFLMFYGLRAREGTSNSNILHSTLGVERSAFASCMFITPALHYSIAPSDVIWMRQLDENILERSAALGDFAYRPMTFDREAENLFAHVRTGFDSQREFFPIVLSVRDHVSNARNLLQLLLAVVVSDLRFNFYSTSLPDLA